MSLEVILPDHAPSELTGCGKEFSDSRQEPEVKTKIFGRILAYFLFPVSGLNENEKLLCVGVCPSTENKPKQKGQQGYAKNSRKQNGRRIKSMCV